MKNNGANPETERRPQSDSHEEFLELCALFTSDSLTEDERSRLERHLHDARHGDIDPHRQDAPVAALGHEVAVQAEEDLRTEADQLGLHSGIGHVRRDAVGDLVEQFAAAIVGARSGRVLDEGIGSLDPLQLFGARLANQRDFVLAQLDGPLAQGFRIEAHLSGHVVGHRALLTQRLV